ncbi:MAG: Na(+) H(+) antiporter subunit C, partial [uncultured Frankineae bacterium]
DRQPDPGPAHRRAVRRRHLPAPAAHPHPGGHRAGADEPRRQPAAARCGRLGRSGAVRRQHRRGRRRRHGRPAAAGDGPDRHRHHLRRDGLPARAGVPQLAADRRGRGAGRRGGPPDRRARARGAPARRAAGGRGV